MNVIDTEGLLPAPAHRLRLICSPCCPLNATAESSTRLPANAAPPKKSHELKMPSTAPPLDWRRRQLHYSFIDVMYIRAVLTLRDNRLSRSKFHNFPCGNASENTGATLDVARPGGVMNPLV